MKKLLKALIPTYVIDFYRVSLAFLANVYFGFPSRKLVVIGVTGTDGKTTTTNLIAKILETSGKSTGILSTILFKVGHKVVTNETKMTTVSAFATQEKLDQMVRAGNTHVVLETSSHALHQYRVWGVAYDVAVMTNLTREHLDYHKTMEEYALAKRRLFSSLEKSVRKQGVAKTKILNGDDKTVESYKSCPSDQTIVYGYKQGDVYAKKVQLRMDGSSFTLVCPQGEIDIELHLPGDFNIMNALAASSAALALGVSLNDIKKGLEAVFGMPGRMQAVSIGSKQDFTVLIDYAVTPHAFEKVYGALQSIPHKKIIAVFGACGDRDREKRSILGGIACQKADYSILTNEDNWSEQPETIIHMIEQGFTKKNYEIIVDRKQAIEKAMSLAKTGDIVLVTGKGVETGMAIGAHQVIPWNEQAVIEEALKNRFV